MTEQFGMLAAFMAALSWSVGVNCYAELSQRYSPSAINFNRAIISIPFFVLVGFLTHGIVGFSDIIVAVNRQEWIWILVASIGSFAFADILFVWSAKYLGAARSLAISSTYPIWSAVAAWVFKNETLGLLASLGLLTVVVATAVVILSKDQKHVSQNDFQNYYLGVTLALVTSFLWGINTYYISLVGHLDLSLVSLFRMLIAFLSIPLVGRLFGFRDLLFKWSDYKKSGAIIFVEAFFGAYFYAYGLSRAPLAVAAALASLSPIIAVPIALVVRKERLSVTALAAVFAVVIGLWLLIFTKAG